MATVNGTQNKTLVVMTTKHIAGGNEKSISHIRCMIPVTMMIIILITLVHFYAVCSHCPKLLQ